MTKDIPLRRTLKESINVIRGKLCNICSIYYTTFFLQGNGKTQIDESYEGHEVQAMIKDK